MNNNNSFMKLIPGTAVCLLNFSENFVFCRKTLFNLFQPFFWIRRAECTPPLQCKKEF